MREGKTCDKRIQGTLAKGSRDGKALGSILHRGHLAQLGGLLRGNRGCKGLVAGHDGGRSRQRPVQTSICDTTDLYPQMMKVCFTGLL